MSEQFNGQVAIVTGAASGLGLAIAKKLHAEGVRVAMLDLNQDATQAASQEVGENAAAFPADITDETQVGRCVAQIGQRFGRIDILVNSAGINRDDRRGEQFHFRPFDAAIHGRRPPMKNKCLYAKPKPCFVIGNVRMRSPVAVKIALLTAGKIGGKAGSPNPVGGLLDFRKWTSMGGVCDIFTNGCS
jgi:short chain dehydrogenase